MEDLALAPFKALGVLPFWSLAESQLPDLKQHYTKITRTFHPDRFAGQAEKKIAEAEAKSAELNAAFTLLRDHEALADFILKSSSCREAPRKKLPPELALEYFEFQELAVENGPQAPEVLAALKTLHPKMKTWLETAKKAFLNILSRYPYKGLGTVAAAPWSQTDLIDLKNSREELRFAQSMMNDFNSRFKEPHADSN